MTKFLNPTRPKPLLPSALNSHVNRETSKSMMYRPEQLEKRVLGWGGVRYIILQPNGMVLITLHLGLYSIP